VLVLRECLDHMLKEGTGGFVVLLAAEPEIGVVCLDSMIWAEFFDFWSSPRRSRLLCGAMELGVCGEDF